MAERTRLSVLGKQVAPPVHSSGAHSGYAVPQSGRADLAAERAKAAFHPADMDAYIHGGAEVAAHRARILLEFERDQTFSVDDAYDLTKAEQRKRVMTRLRAMIHWVRSESPADFTLRLQLLILVDPGFLTRIAVHYGLFLNTILNQGTPTQVDAWIRRGAADFAGIIGCYGMTELGHGSNVAGLETTATYDKATDEFVIHTPTLTATKWWIGGAAESATHSTVFANMVVDGKSYGVKPFVVPLRDPETFALLPGVAIGDCGAKMGRNAIDNGWMQFTHVRVPRTNMLMRYTKVERDGRVHEPPMAQLAYGALIFGRTSIIRESVECAKKAVVIAVRYACVRRQFGSDSKGEESGGIANGSTKARPEMRIIEYQTHQQRLLPMVALTYAMAFTAMDVRATYDDLMARLGSGDAKGAVMVQLISELKDVHATSAGLKAMFTWATLDLIEVCRQSLGGMGYSSYAGLATLFQDFAVQCTWEGDNTVLTLQTGRYLVGAVGRLAGGKAAGRLPRGVAYLGEMDALLKHRTPPSANVADIAVLLRAYDSAAAHSAAAAAAAFRALVQQGASADDAHLRCGVQKLVAARIHCAGYVVHRFAEAVEKAPASLKSVLADLCVLHALWGVRQDPGAFLAPGVLSPSHLAAVDASLLELYARVRPQAIALTDAFGLTDYAVNSPLGCHDGDVYVRVMERARRSTPYAHRHPYYDEVIRPVLLRTEKPAERIPDAS